MDLPKHLGGHANITHTDEASLKYMTEKYGIKTSYDLGCGPGKMVEIMRSKGLVCTGIDGDYTLTNQFKNKDWFIIHDFTKGPLSVDERDLLWSTEFLEHVEEQYMDNYFSVINQCKYALCTASQNPKAHHHVNVKPLEYWVEKFDERGFDYSKEDSEYIRKNSSMKRNFVRDTGMVFIKR